MKAVFCIALVGVLMNVARAEIVAKPVEYSHGDVKLEGFVAHDDKVQGPRPGVLIVHEWWGLTDRNREIAKKLAGMGYVAMAIDMYGKGVVTDKAEEAGKLAGQFKDDPKKMRARAAAGLEVLAAHPQVDRTRIASIGYCFGGTTCLQMAFGGLPLVGVVSFHGGLVSPADDELSAIKARILVLHGADDPLVPAESIKSFQDAMRKAGADWQMFYYGGAVHSFTNPAADKVGIAGVKYDAKTDARSWVHMRAFFDEVFRKSDR